MQLGRQLQPNRRRQGEPELGLGERFVQRPRERKRQRRLPPGEKVALLRQSGQQLERNM